jgi:hypothetical protein
MKAIRPAALDDQALVALLGYQEKVNREADYASMIRKAAELWELRCNNAVFVRIRDVLLRMCTEEQCMYCERSVANQLEHFRPKAFYPEGVFSWPNYLFICNPCNIKKSNDFAVFSSVSGDRVDVKRKRGEAVLEPERGKPVLINPREEDPLDFLMIDLLDTGRFIPRAAAGTRDWIRAEYTTTELLDLNNAGHKKARKNAYHKFTIALRGYVRARDDGGETETYVAVVKESCHPSVWEAMKRDRDLIPELRSLFEEAPEALDW